jgi:aspartate/methionine/tyrosine aminotransferase
MSLPDFRLETFFSRWEFKARWHMCASDVETMSLSDLLALANDDDRAAFENLRLCYSETSGMPRLRHVIGETYDNMSAANVMTFAGAEEGIYAAMHALLAADDHAIVVTPNYQSAESIPASLCAVSGIALDAERDWHLDLQRVHDAIRPETRLISINFPHNPTGKLLHVDDYRQLIEVARARGIYLFSDEVYRGMERDPARRLPQMADSYERGISLNVLSKAWGLPGLRMGWVATGDRDLLSRMERIKHYLSICNAVPSEFLAIIALRARDAILERNRKLVALNLSELNRFFDDYPQFFDWKVPDGACIGFPRYTGADGVENFVQRLVQERSVLLLPASVYRSALTPTPQDRFRIGFGRRQISDGLAEMRRYLESA